VEVIDYLRSRALLAVDRDAALRPCTCQVPGPCLLTPNCGLPVQLDHGYDAELLYEGIANRLHLGVMPFADFVEQIER
jgi:hypothetical protein